MSRYELLERIGAGGMAEIFRGVVVADGGFEKPVAIKRILPELSIDRRFVSLLISEARILSRLRHRNIVQIFDVGVDDLKQYFLVMEFVDGVDLEDLYRYLEARHRRMPLDIALYIAAEVCEALDHAHRATNDEGQPIGLVHRDVSPSNILLSASGEVKLTDFGIAKSVEEATGHGGVRGKFAYISPEQSRNQHVDGRSDAYSLAIVLYELVTGQRLFSGLPEFDALTAVRDPEIPSVCAIEPSLPAALGQLLARALEKDPSRRFPTAGELGMACRALRYALDSPGTDPAKSIADMVKEVTMEHVTDHDDVHTILRAAPPMEEEAAFPEVTRAISILGESERPITLSTRAVPSVLPFDESAAVTQISNPNHIAARPPPLMPDRPLSEPAPLAPVVTSVPPSASSSSQEPARMFDTATVRQIPEPRPQHNPASKPPPEVVATAAVARPRPAPRRWPTARLFALAMIAAVLFAVAFFGARRWLAGKREARATEADAAPVAGAAMPADVDAAPGDAAPPRQAVPTKKKRNVRKARRKKRRKARRQRRD